MILFYTTGSATEGLGHIFRTLGVIATLRDRQILFHCVIRPDTMVESILQNNQIPFSTANTVDEFDAILQFQHPSHLVIDTRAELGLEIHCAKSHGITVVHIDCLNSTRLLADLNIYPNPHFNFRGLDWRRYSGKVIGGADYTLVHPRFMQQRATVPPASHRKRLLVSMGGADPNQVTQMVVQSLIGSGIEWPIDVVIGPAFVHKNPLISESSLVTIHQSPMDLAPLMRHSGVLVTGLGVTMYEAAVLGLPSIVISNFETDREDEKRLTQISGIFPLGHFSTVTPPRLCSTLRRIISDPAQHLKWIEKVGGIVDGNGANRIVDQLVAC